MVKSLGCIEAAGQDPKPKLFKKKREDNNNSSFILFVEFGFGLLGDPRAHRGLAAVGGQKTAQGFGDPSEARQKQKR